MSGTDRSGCPSCDWGGKVAVTHGRTHRYFTHVIVKNGEVFQGQMCSERIRPKKRGLVKRVAEGLGVLNGTPNADRGARDAIEDTVEQADSDTDGNDETEQAHDGGSLACDADGCAFMSDSERGLNIHKARMHDGDSADDGGQSDGGGDAPTIWCGLCGDGFPTERGAKIHGSRVHDEIVLRDEEPDPEIECDDCGRVYSVPSELQDHRSKSRCGAELPADVSAADLEAIVNEADTLLEVQQELRELNRRQTKALLEDHGLLDEIATAGTRSPQALADSLDFDEDDDEDVLEGDDSWREFHQKDT